MALKPANMGEALWIGHGAGSNFFNVGVGQGTSNGANQHTDYVLADIVSGAAEAAEPTKFFLSTTGDATFHINASAGTTSTNTVHPRSELRELGADGNSNAAWDSRTNKHYMWGRSRMTAFTDRRPWICFFQIHGSSNSPNTSDLIRIQTEGANGTTTGLDIVSRHTPPGSSTETRTVLRSASYNQSDWVSWQIQMGGDTAADNGRIQIWLDGVRVLNITGMGQIACYFKTGCYLQDSVAEGAGSGTGGTVEMAKGTLVVWHTGYPATTQPIFTGADDGLGGGTDTTPPTVPAHLFGVRNNGTALLSWDESTDLVGVTGYKVYRTSSQDTSSSTAQLGKITNGTGASTSSAAKTVVSKFTAATSGTLSAGHARLWIDSGTGNVQMCVYADNAGLPGALLAQSNVVAVTNTTEAQKDFTFTSGNAIPIGSGTVYWIGFTWPDPGTPIFSWSRDATASQAQNNSVNLANPFGTPAAALSGPIDAFVDVATATVGTVLVATVTDTNFLDTGRTNGVPYTYTVSAIDAAANESAKSDPVTVTPGAPDVTAPSVPTGLQGTPGDRKATIFWNPSTDTDTGVREYRVYRNGVQITSVSAPTTTYTDLELTNGSGYVYTVSAVDNSLNESAQSSSVTITPATAPIVGVPFLEDALGRGAKIGLEIAFGADLAADPSTWVWTDATPDMRAAPGLASAIGRADESSTSNPATFSVVLTNKRGDYSLGGRSKWWPYIRRNTPVRLRIDPADLGGGRVVFMGGADGWTPGWDSLTGKIPVVTLSASGTLRRLAQGKAPLHSAYRRAMESTPSVLSYWPLEEGKLATTVQAVRGGSALQIEGKPDWATNTAFICSDALLTMKSSRLAVFPNPYTNTGKTQVRCLIELPEDITNIPNGAVIFSVVMTGSIVRWDVAFTNSPGLELRAYPVGGGVGTELVKTNAGFGIQGIPGRLSLELTEAGGGVQYALSFKDATQAAGSGGITGTVPGRTAGLVSWIMFGATQNANDAAFGHLTLQNTITSTFEATDALIAFQGEYASSGAVNPFISRLERLASENGVPLNRFTSPATVDPAGLLAFDTMGPQTIAPLLTLMREAEAADDGQLWDGRSNGLSYTTRRRREQGILRLTVDASKGQLSAGFAPTNDDQRTRNKVEVKRSFGTAATWEDFTGPLGTGEIGIYDESVTLNIGRDDDVLQHAQWRVAQGTVEGHRYPSVTVDLRLNPKLAAAVLDMIPGERIDVIGLDTTLHQFTESSVSLIVEGIAHAITPKTWLVTFSCSPLEGVGIGRVAAPTGDTDDMVMRVDTDGSQTTAQVEKGFTSLPVVSTGATWTTNSDDFPLYLEVGGLPIRATACGNPTDAGALPVVRSRFNGAFDTQVAAHPISFGAIVPGDLLVVIFANDDAAVTADASAGWTKVSTLGATGHLASVYTRKATGSDPLIVTTSAPSATDPNNLLMEKAFEITSTAENSTKDWRAQYTYIQDIGDGRGLTAGISGFTSADGDMLEIVQNWTNINPSNILAKYVGGLEVCVSVGEGGSASSTATAQLGAQYLLDWATASTDPVWQGVQREYRDRVYWAPAYAAAIADGLGPLGVAIYYDTSTNHGPGDPNSNDGSFDDIRSRTTGTKPSAGGSEVTWLTNFLNLRETVLAGPLFNDAPADGRVPMFRVMINGNQFLLNYPITWSVYGDAFSITTDPPVDGSSTTIVDAAQEGTYISLAIQNAQDVTVGVASGTGTSGTAPALTLPSGNYLGVVALTTDSVGGTAEVFTQPSGFVNQVTRNPAVTTSAAVSTAEKAFAAATAITPGGFTLGTSEPWVAFTIAVSAVARTTQVFTVDPLPVPRSSGSQVQLWKPRRVGMG